MNTEPDKAVHGSIVACAVAAGVVLLAGEPVALGPPTFSSGYVVRGVAVLVFGTLVLALAAIERGRLAPPRGLALAWTLLPLLVVVPAVLALSNASDAMRPLAQHGMRWIVLALAPAALAFVFGRADRVGRLLGVLATVAGALAVFGLVERANGGKMAAGFGRPAVAGAMFAALIVPAWCFGPGRGTVTRWLLPGFLFVAVLLSSSRAAAGAAVFGVLFAVAVGSSSRVMRRWASIAAVALVAVAVVAIGLASRGSLDLPGGNQTIAVRLGLHRASLTLVGERPLRGHGLGRYPAEALRARDVEEARLEVGRRPEHAHFDALHVSVEGGLLAGLALLVFVGGAFGYASRRARDADRGTRLALAAAVGTIATLAVAGFGDGIQVAPGPLFLLAVAVAAVIAAGPPREEPARPSRIWQGAWLAGAAALLLFAVFAAKIAIADRHTQAYVNTRIDSQHRVESGVLALEEAQKRMAVAKREHLDPAVRLDPKNAEAQYQLGVFVAALEPPEFAAASDAFRAAIAADPGKTEARLDLALVFEIQQRHDDGRAVLEEAARRDPTRYDVWMRLGHLALGPEPIPGDPPVDRDWEEVLRPYNRARALQPDRFENDVALARVLRYRAKSKADLAAADALLERSAMRFAPAALQGTEKTHEMFLRAPAEITLEAFRVAEAMGAGDLILREFLKFALAKDPELGSMIRREVDGLFEVGQIRGADARKAAAESLNPRVFDPVEQIYDSAAMRLAALLDAGLVDPQALLEQARADRGQKHFRPALARYRAILAWVEGPYALELLRADPEQGIRWNSELLKETAIVAQRVDAGRARTYWSRHFLLEGVIAMGERDVERAIARLRKSLEYDDELADTHFELARAYAQIAEYDAAVRSLVRSLELDPSGNRGESVRAAAEDLGPILERPEVMEALEALEKKGKR